MTFSGVPADVSPLGGLRVALVLATSTGGVGRHVRSLAEGLRARGAQVAVLGPAATDTLFDFTGRGARFAAVEISDGIHPLAGAHSMVRLRGLLRGAEVVHAHGLRAGLVAGVALRFASAPARSRPPYLVSWHNALLETAGSGAGTRARVGRAVQRGAARLADVTLGASTDLVWTARAVGAEEARLVPVAAPPLPPARRSRQEVRAELGAGERPLVLAVGRLSAQKDYPTLFEAVASWTGDRQPLPLVAVAGDGPLSGDLAARVQQQQLPVRLLGHRGDVADLLGAADVVVLPSLWEARSLVAQEAMRAGRPVVATAAGGMPDLVGEAGLLVPPREPFALADAVRRLLDEPALAGRLAAAGRARAAGFPTEDDTTDHVAGLYRELLDSRG